jgi:adenosylcobinamide-phosphate guanylyltransferase
MFVTAVVMAGGKGSRMSFSEEKPLLRVGGKPVVERVLSALLNANRVDSVVVAVSRRTPKTALFVSKFPVKVVETPGEGYIPDMQYVVKKLGLKTVLAIVSDLPLITNTVVDDVLERYVLCGKPALTVAVPIETKTELGAGVEYDFEADGKTVVPTGINVIDGRLIDGGWMDQEVYVIDKPEVAANVNTPEDLQLAESLRVKVLKEQSIDKPCNSL